MADSNSQQPRCPCGFWGSAQTLGLCSKCYKDHQKKNSDADSAGAVGSSSGSLTKAFTASTVPTSVMPEINVTPTQQQCKDASKDTENTEPSTSGSENADPTSNSEESEKNSENTLDPDRPVQKNKKRCFKCNVKMELAHREIGRCRCDYIFCQLHRLPEQHDCIFDHKETGRKAAREKMVSPKKHMGTSLRRLDSDS